jgi:hypothetical protein
MKKLITIFILLTSGLLVAQQFSKPAVFTGLVLEVGNNRINFNEAWIQMTAPETKAIGQVAITNEHDQPISYKDLRAPFMAELTVRIIRGKWIPVKIKVLEQFQYNDKGLITRAFGR